MVAVVAPGVAGCLNLPVAALPNVDFPTIQVSAQLPGADAKTTASSVATPLERQFGQIPGITQMTSSSGRGLVGCEHAGGDRGGHQGVRSGCGAGWP